MAIVSYKEKIEAIGNALQPLALQHDLGIAYSDQRLDQLRDSKDKLLYIGIHSYDKMSYQTYTTTWNATQGYYDVVARVAGLTRFFIDYYASDYSFIDIAQEVPIVLAATPFVEQNMTASFFEHIDNLTNPAMFQGFRKQFSKVIAAFMVTDEIQLPPVYKADRITVEGVIHNALDTLNFDFEVNLDG